MESKQSTKVKLGLLEELDLSDVNVLEGENGLGSLLDFSANDFRNELRSELSQSDVGALSDHDVSHLLSDLSQLRSLSISGLLDLVRQSLGESNGENSNVVVVGGLNSDVSLDEILPLSNKRSELVRSEVQTVEVGQKVLALDLVNSQLDSSESVVLLALQVSKTDIDNSALEFVVGVLQTSASVDQGLANISVLESGRSLDVVPFLLGEGVNDSLLNALLSLGKSLILADSHVGFLL